MVLIIIEWVHGEAFEERIPTGRVVQLERHQLVYNILHYLEFEYQFQFSGVSSNVGGY
jgi:hypothetical protein